MFCTSVFFRQALPILDTHRYPPFFQFIAGEDTHRYRYSPFFQFIAGERT